MINTEILIEEETKLRLNDKLSIALRYLSQKPTGIKKILYEPNHKSKEVRKIPLDSNGESIPTIFYRMLAGIYFDILQTKFGEDVVTDGTIIGSVFTGTAKIGSDIDGSIFVSDESIDKIGEINAYQKAVYSYIEYKIGQKNFCIWNLNIFNRTVMGDIYLEGGGLGLDLRSLKNLVESYR